MIQPLPGDLPSSRINILDPVPGAPGGEKDGSFAALAPYSAPPPHGLAEQEKAPGVKVAFRALTDAESEALLWMRTWLAETLAHPESRLTGRTLEEQLTAGVTAYNAHAHSRGGVQELLDLALVPLLCAHYTGWRQLYPYARRPDVTSIFVNGPHSVYVEREGKQLRVGAGLSEDDIAALVNKLTGLQLTQGSPVVEARTLDGSRLSAVHATLSEGGSTLAFRRYPRRYSLNELIQLRMLTQLAAEFLREAVQAGLSIVVSGGTGSGKTTLLQALIDTLPKTTRLGLVEQRPELRPHGDNFVQMHAQPATVEGHRAYSLTEMVQAILWQQPDRVVVGECRGPEALAWLRAANSGHDGCMTSIHAEEGAQSAIWVLEALVSEGNPNLTEANIRRRIATGIQLLIHARRLRSGRRVVTEIIQVVPSPSSAGAFASSPLFRADPERDWQLAHTEHQLDAHLAERFTRAGLSTDLWRRTAGLPGGGEGRKG
jgi:pilus assembly protein CpaF